MPRYTTYYQGVGLAKPPPAGSVNVWGCIGRAGRGGWRTLKSARRAAEKMVASSLSKGHWPEASHLQRQVAVNTAAALEPGEAVEIPSWTGSPERLRVWIEVRE